MGKSRSRIQEFVKARGLIQSSEGRPSGFRQRLLTPPGSEPVRVAPRGACLTAEAASTRPIFWVRSSAPQQTDRCIAFEQIEAEPGRGTARRIEAAVAVHEKPGVVMRRLHQVRDLLR
jgi:hypothetical protein